MESGGVLAGSLHTTKHLLPSSSSSSSLLSPTHLLPSSKRHSSLNVHDQLPFSNSNLRLVSLISKRQASTTLSSAISKAHFMKVCAWFPHEGCCNSILLENNHPCVEGAMHHACPICFEYLFESTNDGSVLPCGHTMHVSCLKEI